MVGRRRRLRSFKCTPLFAIKDLLKGKEETERMERKRTAHGLALSL